MGDRPAGVEQAGGGRGSLAGWRADTPEGHRGLEGHWEDLGFLTLAALCRRDLKGPDPLWQGPPA